MEIVTQILIFVAVVFGIGIYFMYVFFGKNRKNQNSDKDQSFLLLQQQMAELAKTLNSSLTESRRDMQDVVRAQFSDSQKLIKDIKFIDSKSNVMIQVADMLAGVIRRYKEETKDDAVEYWDIISKKIDDCWDFR